MRTLSFVFVDNVTQPLRTMLILSFFFKLTVWPFDSMSVNEGISLVSLDILELFSLFICKITSVVVICDEQTAMLADI